MSEIDLSAPEVQSAIEKAARKIFDDEAAGLKAKNDELLGKIKKLQKDAAIDPADLEAAERERDEWKGKAQAAEKAAKKATGELEAANKARDDIDAAFRNTTKDAALTEALTKAGVTPALLAAAKALHGSKAEVVDENGTRVVKVGGKPIGDAITEWAGSDEGKHFVAAPDHNGGGSRGGQGGHGTKPVKDWTDSDKALFIREHGLPAWQEKLKAG